MNETYSMICDKLGIPIEINIPNHTASEDKIRRRETVAMKTIAGLMAFSYLKIMESYGLDVASSINQLKRVFSKSSTRNSVKYFVDNVPIAVQGLSQLKESPTPIGLTALGLLRIIPGANLKQAGLRQKYLQYILKDQASTEIYHRNIPYFMHRGNFQGDLSMLLGYHQKGSPMTKFIKQNLS